jgi:hypothetical protein
MPTLLTTHPRRAKSFQSAKAQSSQSGRKEEKRKKREGLRLQNPTFASSLRPLRLCG